jgi:mevalonate kinase
MTGVRPALIASTPGKVILMGEHAAVYGRPAVVAACGLRAEARFDRPREEGRVEIDLADLGHRESLSWERIVDVARRARDLWRSYAGSPSPAGFSRLRSDDPAHLVKVALGETAESLAVDRRRGLALRLRSQIPVGSGFGSSAAVAVSVVAGSRRWLGAADDATEVERLAFEVERRQHGLPSGVDHATALRGGVVWAQRRESGDLEVERLGLAGGALDGIRVYDSGEPPEPTGVVVAAVAGLLRENRAMAERVLDEMESCVRALRRALERGGRDLGELFRDYEALLESLGVVPEPIRLLVRRIERRGGAAKISGAGSLGGPGAGSLLVVDPCGGPRLPSSLFAGCRPVVAALGGNGLSLEEL